MLGRLDLSGEERVLDAGCGSGRVTELLLERLPAGYVVALDASEAMIGEARRRLRGAGRRVGLVVADLAAQPPLGRSVDAILSTATFHWIRDHDALFRHLASVLRPGGRLAAQCGGTGNIGRLRDAVLRLGVSWDDEAYFAGPRETRTRLEDAGFVDVVCWLQEEPTRVEPGERLETYLRTVCLRSLVEPMAGPQGDAFVRRAAEQLPDGELDYVRLNIAARRAGAP